MQRDPGSLSWRCPGILLSRSTGAQEPGDSACEPAVGAQGRHRACLRVPPQPGAPSLPRLGDILALRHQDARLRRAAKGALRSARHPGTGSRQPPSCSAKGTYLPSRPLQMPGGTAAGNPGPSPASGPQAEPQRRRSASQGAAALPAGGFSVSFRALAGTGLPGARRGRGRECARVGRCGRAWMWVCMCVCVFMGEVGVCVRV